MCRLTFVVHSDQLTGTRAFYRIAISKNELYRLINSDRQI
jgi:hypothetical protein